MKQVTGQSASQSVLGKHRVRAQLGNGYERDPSDLVAGLLYMTIGTLVIGAILYSAVMAWLT